MNIFTSEGSKRKIAAALSVLLGLAGMVPGTAGIVQAIQAVAAFFGVTGLVHAGLSGTVSKTVLGSISALAVSLAFAAQWIPSLAPIAGHLQYLASVAGAAALGAGKLKKQ